MTAETLLHEPMPMGRSNAKLFAALAKAQGAFEAAKKDRANDFLKSSYATLSSVIEACRKPLADNGLCVIQSFAKDAEGRLNLVTTMGHESGESVSSWLPVENGADERGLSRLQVFGKQITYLRRYSYLTVVGVAVAEDEDDGNVDGQTTRRTTRNGPTTPANATEHHDPDPQDQPKPLTPKELALERFCSAMVEQGQPVPPSRKKLAEVLYTLLGLSEGASLSVEQIDQATAMLQEQAEAAQEAADGHESGKKRGDSTADSHEKNMRKAGIVSHLEWMKEHELDHRDEDLSRHLLGIALVREIASRADLTAEDWGKANHALKEMEAGQVRYKVSLYEAARDAANFALAVDPGSTEPVQDAQEVVA